MTGDQAPGGPSGPFGGKSAGPTGGKSAGPTGGEAAGPFSGKSALPMGGQQNAADAHPAGLLDHLRDLFGAGAAYLQARLALAGIEAKEALLHFGLIIALFLFALALIVYGYLFLCIAATVLIARLLCLSPGWVILALALIHLAIAAGAILFALSRLKLAVFAGTLAELKKDQQWLNRTSK
jgi:uncharacterized membrane protein YqjE